MKILKRLLIGLLVLVVLAAIALLLAPILFKDQIVANVKSSVNQQLTAEVDFADVDLSFLRSFPDVTLTVEELTVVGVDTFAGLPLLSAEETRVEVGFWSVVGGDGNYNVESVEMDRPRINLKVLSPELANYLITGAETTDPASNTDPAPASPQINLNHFAVREGHFVYDDRTTDTYVEMSGLDVEGNGDFTDVIFNLDLEAEANRLTLRQAGTAYLNQVVTTVDGTINVDMNRSRYTFLDTEARLNALDLVFAGSIDLEDNDDILFDLDYRAPANDFRQLWSLIPATYTSGYEDVKTTGAFTLAGTVDGTYNGERERYPAFTLKTEITDGSVQYPGRPVGINGIDALVDVVSPGADLDDLTVNIPRFAFTLGGDPFRGSFRLATPLSDLQVDTRLAGKLDLAKWAQAIPLEGVRELAGVIVADVTARGVRQSLLERGRYGDLELSGEVSMTDFVYAADELPVVRMERARAEFTPRAISVPNFAMTLGRSDLSGGGEITNPLAYFNPEQTLRGNFRLRSDFFDADEWMPAEETAPAALSPAEIARTTAEAEEPTAAVFDRFDFDVDATIGELKYATYRPRDLRAVGNVKPNRLNVRDMAAILGESSLTGSGVITDLFDYTFADGTLGGNLSMRSDFIDLADFMTEEETAAPSQQAAPAGTAAVPIPENIALTVDLRADRLKYDNIDLDGLNGRLVLQNGQAVVQDGQARLFGGSVDFEGAYDTSEPGDPGFRFHYDLESLDFGQTFATLNTFAALAPIGKFLRGRFSTDMVIEGKLGEDLFPKLNTIDAEGLFKTAEAQITGFGPLRSIGEKLNINELRNSTTLRNLIAAFTVEDGQVTVEPFDVRLAGFPVNVSGRHGLDQDMNYALRAAVPRDLIEGNLVTGTALGALDRLAGQAGKLGLNISPGDTLNLAINVLGSIGAPQLKFDLLGSQGGGSGGVQGAVQDQVRRELDERKEQARAEIDNRVDAARDQAQARVDSLRRIADERARRIQDSIRRAAAAQTDRLRQQANRELQERLRLDSLRADSLLRKVPGADRIQDKLDRFNPFKKKKDGGGKR